MIAARDPYKYFRVEARELVETLTRGVLQLEKGAAGPPVIDGLLRAAHTLKGAARVVRQPVIAEKAHAIEGVLSPARESPAALLQPQIGELLALIDAISGLLASIGPAPPPNPAQAGAADTAAAEPFETLRVDIEQMDGLLGDISDACVQVGGLRRSIDSLGRLRRLASSLAEQLARRRRPSPNDRMLSLAEELMESLDQIQRDLVAGMERAQSDLVLVRQRAIRARLIPVSAIFGALERAVSDTARAVGRSVAFEAVGGDARIDGHVLSALRDALIHVVRNAVDHGIENEDERSAAGKPLMGRVALRVEQRGNRLAFIVTDDGRGIDVEAVRRVAVARGLVPSEQAATLGPAEVARLALKAGLSTRAGVTQVSGRGVGLDVVRETVSRFKGEVDIRTSPARGATIEILVPVSLSSLIVLLFESGGVVTSVPLDAVSRTLWLGENQVAHSPEGDTILYDGSAIPICPLERILWKRRHADHRAAPRAPHARPALVLAAAGASGAVFVDRLIGTSEVAVRPIPGNLDIDPVVAGACFDAGGNPQLVLDPERVLAAVRALSGAAPESAAARAMSVLVIDDSLTTRMLEQSILESAGYHVDLATSGEEGLRKARERAYNLFMVDVEMPGMTGFEFIGHARDDGRLRHIPAIILTSRATEEDRRRSEEVGARAFMVKSEFDQTQLLRTIRELVS